MDIFSVFCLCINIQVSICLYLAENVSYCWRGEALSRKLCGSVKGLARGSRTGAFEVELVVGGQNIQSFKNQGVKF